MSRSIDSDPRPKSSNSQSRMPLSQGRAGTGQNADFASERDRPAARSRAEGPLSASRHDERQALTLARDLARLKEPQQQMLADIGRFRTVAAEDLTKYRYGGRTDAFREDVAALKARGLLTEHRLLVKAGQRPIRVLALTPKGKALAAVRAEHQQVYAGLKKPREVAHDAAIYRMYQAEAARIEAAGGRIRRVVLDYELKQKLFSELAKTDAAHYRETQARLAEENGLKVVDGKVPLPDLRIEYDTPDGERTKVDLELATEHYHARHLGEKAQAGFKMYAPAESAGRLRSAWDDHDLMGEVLSL